MKQTLYKLTADEVFYVSTDEQEIYDIIEDLELEVFEISEETWYMSIDKVAELELLPRFAALPF